MDLSILSFRQKIFFISGTILQKLISFIPGYRNLERIQRFYYEIKKQGFSGISTGENEILVSYKIEDNTVRSILRKNGSDNKIFTHLILWNEYKETINYINKMLSFDEKLLFFDCGGNIGLASIYFSSFFPQIHVVAIEPFYESFMLMKKNLLLNNIHIIKLYESALWNTSSKLYISNDYRDSMEWSFRVSNSKTASIQEINSVTLKHICNENHITCIDIIKIDIEGAEKEVILDCEENRNIFATTKCIIVEVHDDIHAGLSSEISNYFANLGFHFQSINENIVFINSKYCKL